MGRRILFIVVGFIAGAIAVATFHQGVVWALKTAGMLPNATPWSTEQVTWTIPGWQTLQVPRLVNWMFWGGVWGAVFGLIFGGLGRPLLPIVGIIFGIIGPMMIGGWGLVPYFKGETPFPVRYETGALTFYDSKGQKIAEPAEVENAKRRHLIRAAIEGSWGFGTGIFLALLRGRNRSGA